MCGSDHNIGINESKRIGAFGDVANSFQSPNAHIPYVPGIFS